MNIQELISLLYTIDPDEILYCFPETDDDAQALADEFPSIRIIQELGRWLPGGTRTPVTTALSIKFDVVCIPSELLNEMLPFGITCLKRGGYLLSDGSIETRGSKLKTGIKQNGIFQYKNK